MLPGEGVTEEAVASLLPVTRKGVIEERGKQDCCQLRVVKECVSSTVEYIAPTFTACGTHYCSSYSTM